MHRRVHDACTRASSVLCLVQGRERWATHITAALPSMCFRAPGCLPASSLPPLFWCLVLELVGLSDQAHEDRSACVLAIVTLHASYHAIRADPPAPAPVPEAPGGHMPGSNKCDGVGSRVVAGGRG